MYQLFYNDSFTDIDKELIYYKNLNDMPREFLSFIENKLDSVVIYEYSKGNYYCAKCLNKLDGFSHCKQCNKSYRYSDTTWSTSNLKTCTSLGDKYYYFDIVNDNILVYEVSATLDIYNSDVIESICTDDEIEHRISNSISYSKRIGIESVICIKKTKIINLHNKKIYSHIEFKERTNIFDDWGYIYTSNLELLKDTKLFKYIPLWKCIDYFKRHRVKAKDVIYYSLNNKCFEYLINYKLYNLAFNEIEYKGSFKKTFGVGKEYLDFMVENNIDTYDLEVLRLLKVKDYSLIRSVSARWKYIKSLKELNEYNINLLDLLKYFKDKKLDYDLLEKYIYYIKLLLNLDINIKDKEYLYPDDFYEVCNIAEELNNYRIEENIEKVGNTLEINKYEDDKYIIYPPKTIGSIIDEATQQGNCLADYIVDYSEGKSHIYFMRKKDEKEKSLVTIEVNNNQVIQARARFNEDPSDEQIRVIENWEQKLIPVSIEI